MLDIYTSEACSGGVVHSLEEFLSRHDLTHLTEGGLIVDMACGKGTLLGLLKQRFPEAEYLGIDVRHDTIEDAAKEYPEIDFLRGDIMDTGLPSNSVSIATAVAIIDYANGRMDSSLSLPKYAKEIERVLIPGGIYFPWDIRFDEECTKHFVDAGLEQHDWLCLHIFQKRK